MSLVNLIHIIKSSTNVSLSALSGKIQRVVNTGSSSITVTFGTDTIALPAGYFADFWYDGTWYSMINNQYSFQSVYLDSQKIGKIEIFDDYYDPSVTFPYYCLSRDDETITKTNWPDVNGTGLITHLRSKKIKYMPGTASAKSAFDVTAWAISSNVATLAFANTTAENKILAALAEDQLIHGSYTDWRTITLASAIGSITAGTYAITAIDTVNRTVSFAFTASNGSGSVSATAEFYPHRLSTAADSGGTQARHFKVQGRGFVTVNDSDGEFIGSLRRRDKMQGHRHATNGAAGWSGAGGWTTGGIYNPVTVQVLDPTTDGVNGTPRTGNKTHGPGFGVVAYIYGKTYSA